MSSSWRPGCPVPLADLRYVRLSYVDFGGAPHAGELVVHADATGAVIEAFRRLYEQRFPIRSMRLVDDFGGSDDASMDADNTSAFNCRPVTGGTGWSRHAYGRAVDINPVENPYVRGGIVLPPAGRDYLDRSPARPGMVEAGAVDAFAAVGWSWGGTFSTGPDYQHFSADGR
jgi:hypothetical protein